MNDLFFHPKLAHVPMALGVLMPLLAGVLLLAWWRQWLPRRAWLLAIGAQALLLGSGMLAIRTGENEEDRVESVVAGRFLEAHEEAAKTFVWGSGAVLALMLLAAALGSRRAGLPLAGAAVLGTVVVLGLGYRTGHTGGSLVYEHGAAQAYTPNAAGAPAKAERDDH